jgi:hypothetical protein
VEALEMDAEDMQENSIKILNQVKYEASNTINCNPIKLDFECLSNLILGKIA